MDRFVSRTSVLAAMALIAIALQPRSAFGQCGNCGPGTTPGFGGVSDHAYRFDSSVPDYIQQATYWADDGWNAPYHDQNDSNATTISVVDEPQNPDLLGYYQPGSNTLSINMSSDILSDCPDPGCNALVAVIAHELGHTFGLADIFGGCETSIMSYDSDLGSVLGPSEEDLCWLFHYTGSGGGQQECPDPENNPCMYERKSGQTLLFRLDTSGTQGVSWVSPLRAVALDYRLLHDAANRADLIAVIRLQNQPYREETSAGSILTRFRAEVLEIVGGRQALAASREIALTWDGGVGDSAGIAIPSGIYLAFLEWDDRSQSYALPLGPDVLALSLVRLLFQR